MRRSLLVFLALLCGLPAAEPPDGPVDAAVLERHRAQITASTSLDDAARATALNLLQQAQGELSSATRLGEELAQRRLEAEAVAGLIAQLRERIDKEREPVALPTALDLDGATALLGQRQADLVQAQARLTATEQELEGARTLTQRAVPELADLAQRLEAPETPLPDNELPDLTWSRRLADAANRQALRARRDLLEFRLAVLPQVLPLREITREWQAVLVERYGQEIVRIQSRIDALRQENATATRQQAQQAQAQAVDDPALRAILDRNVALATELEGLVRQEGALTQDLERARAKATVLAEDFSVAQQRLEMSPLTETTALAWQAMRKSLPSSGTQTRRIAQRVEGLGVLNDTVFLCDRELRKQTDGGQTQDAGQAEARRQRRNLLERTRETARRCIRLMEQLDAVEQDHWRVARDFSHFLDLHLLWTRSAKPLSLAEVGAVPAAGWSVLVASAWWHPLRTALVADGQIWWLFLALLFIAVLTVLRPWLRRQANRELTMDGRPRTVARRTSLVPILHSLMITFVLAGTGPALLGFLAWRVDATGAVGDGVPALVRALTTVALIWLVLGFLREISRDDGLAARFFRWREPTRRLLRRSLAWYLVLALPLRFVRTLAEADGAEAGLPVARIGLLLHTALMTAFLVILFRAGSALMVSLRERTPDSWMQRTRWLWYPLLVLVPPIQAGLATAGFQYSAGIIDEHFRTSLWWLVGIVLINDLILYAIGQTKRRILLAGIERQREAEAVPADGAIEGGLGLDDARQLVATIDGKTRSLLRIGLLYIAIVGLWVIWDEVLPALRYLDGIALWQVAGQGHEAPAIPITLMGLIAAVFGLLLTFVTGYNLPMVLDIILLHRSRLEAGVRHAIRVLSGYTIVAIGLVLVIRSLGVSWNSVQWLVAALGIGLGFGLQEVVANFVSGIIILVERPYRIGDVISVGDTSGTVTNISIRATRILDWDRRELIVPNKDFVTASLTNWSLSDPITRMTIAVGIAYGSDTVRALAILTQLARDHAGVLDDPPPEALFLGFGDNSLNLDLRVFIGDILQRFTVRHELHLAIDAAFREAGIVIAFPQRDVHFDVTQPVAVQLMPPPVVAGDDPST